ncbi:hypothetical protein C5708_16705 [Caulobacter sp. CCUG 60055]|uniref:hypothetical protein n=1 Tax=Caulobacter sp. CCUG 60055 TaxID=2100090 RepID=UPI001FA74A0D|nr:hypothetical protein [Caulobacter sp. CCUG 60055]MBQ1541730.1 hypothetical protein [Caulobacteraceae bacterium]MCI3181887.1 hypothetical protein [Caulobacter sp. CCUG 60055]
MQPDVQAFLHAETGVTTWVVADPATGLCAIIDPVLDAGGATASADALIAAIRERDFGPTWILETRADGPSAAAHVKYETGASVAGAAGPGREPDSTLSGGETLPLGALAIAVVNVPGRGLAYAIGERTFAPPEA